MQICRGGRDPACNVNSAVSNLAHENGLSTVSGAGASLHQQFDPARQSSRATSGLPNSWTSSTPTSPGRARTYRGTTYSGLDPNFPALGSAPNTTTPVVGGATVADFTNNPHHNWLQDKASAYAGSSSFGLQPYTALQAPWQNFTNAINGSSQDFMSGLQDLADSIASTVQNPTGFGDGDIGAFMDAISNLVKGLLELCDAALDTFMDLATLATDALGSLLTTPIDVDALQALWTWLATAAGYPDDNELTVASLVSLLAAFPTTVIYKLILGTEHEPFPSSQDLHALRARTLGSPMPAGCVLASAILQTVSAAPAICADLLGANSPMWLSLALMADSIVIWALANGYRG